MWILKALFPDPHHCVLDLLLSSELMDKSSWRFSCLGTLLNGDKILDCNEFQRDIKSMDEGDHLWLRACGRLWQGIDLYFS